MVEQSWHHAGVTIAATDWRYSSTAGLEEINICQQRLQVPYIPECETFGSVAIVQKTNENRRSCYG